MWEARSVYLRSGRIAIGVEVGIQTETQEVFGLEGKARDIMKKWRGNTVITGVEGRDLSECQRVKKRIYIVADKPG